MPPENEIEPTSVPNPDTEPVKGTSKHRRNKPRWVKQDHAGSPPIYTQADNQVLEALGMVRPRTAKIPNSTSLNRQKLQNMLELRGKFEVIAYRRLARASKDLIVHAIKLAKDSTIKNPTPLIMCLHKLLPDAVHRVEITHNNEAEEGRRYLDNLKSDPRTIELIEELTERIVRAKTIDVTPSS